jgi:hypothetical protein
MRAAISRRRALAAADRIAARPWWFLAGWAAVVGSVHGVIWSGRGWSYFVSGAHLLFSPVGLHLYAAHSDLQIGPLTFLVVAPFVFGLPPAGAEAAGMVAMCGAGLVVLAQIRRLVPSRGEAGDRAFLLAGLCFVLVWPELAVTYAHPDDVLAILGTVVALRALHRGQPAAAGLLLGLAADCKPWALAFVPLLLLAGRRSWARAFVIWVAVVAAAWLPFLAADPGTLAVARYRIAVSLASPLRVLGVTSAAVPGWVRPAQLLLGVLLSTVVLRRGSWSAVILVVIAARLLLDPSIKSYYDAGLLTGSVLADLVLLAARLPAFTLSALLVFYLPMFPLQAAPQLYGLLRLAYLLAVIAAVTVPPGSAPWQPGLPPAGQAGDGPATRPLRRRRDSSVRAVAAPAPEAGHGDAQGGSGRLVRAAAGRGSRRSRRHLKASLTRNRDKNLVLANWPPAVRGAAALLRE